MESGRIVGLLCWASLASTSRWRKILSGRADNACCAIEKGSILWTRDNALILRVGEQALLVILKRSSLRQQQIVEVVRVADSQARSDGVCSTCIVAGAIVSLVVGSWHIIAYVLGRIILAAVHASLCLRIIVIKTTNAVIFPIHKGCFYRTNNPILSSFRLV